MVDKRRQVASGVLGGVMYKRKEEVIKEKRNKG